MRGIGDGPLEEGGLPAVDAQIAGVEERSTVGLDEEGVEGAVVDEERRDLDVRPRSASARRTSRSSGRGRAG
jgi:hypothetical protein